MYLTRIIINYIYEVGLSPALDLSSDFPVWKNLKINDFHSGKHLVENKGEANEWNSQNTWLLLGEREAVNNFALEQFLPCHAFPLAVCCH